MENIHNCCGGHKARFHVLIVVLSIFIAVLTISSVVGIGNKVKEGQYIGKNPDMTNVITVAGQGEVYAKPDLGLIDLTVVTEKPTSQSAMKENSARMNKVIEFVKSKGVQGKDIKTTNFNINPRYNYIGGGFSSGTRVLAGYEVTQTLQVKIRDLDKVGEILEGATSAGVNNVGDLTFTIDDEEELKKQARAEAIAKAKQRAKDLASELDVDLVRIVSFSENSYDPYYGFGLGGAIDSLSIEKAVVPEIETGENKISVSVNITYEIN